MPDFLERPRQYMAEECPFPHHRHDPGGFEPFYFVPSSFFLYNYVFEQNATVIGNKTILRYTHCHLLICIFIIKSSGYKKSQILEAESDSFLVQ